MAEKLLSVALGFFDGVHLGHAAVISAALSRKEYAPAVFTFKSRSPLPKLENTRSADANITGRDVPRLLGGGTPSGVSGGISPASRPVSTSGSAKRAATVPSQFAYGELAAVINTDGVKHKLLKSLGVKHIYSYDFLKIKHFTPEAFVSEVLVKTLNAKVVCCGYDFRFGEGGRANPDDLAGICGRLGVETIVAPPVKIDGVTVSSTFIRGLIAEGEITKANRFLGYELYYEGRVVGGNMIGRTIGFPTINQMMPRGCVLPKFGVYKSRVYIGDEVLDGITNIGVKPTAGHYRNASAETHIIGFGGDLYGKKIKISLVGFIRGEKKFASFDELKEQIKKDIEVINAKS